MNNTSNTDHPLWTTATAVHATKALSSVGEWTASGVSIDSRTVKPGDLFVALRGHQYDGHDFVHHALNAGAVAVCVTSKPQGLSSDVPCLVVADTLKALYDLGQARRKQSKAQIIAVTGSVGKTSTKQILGHILSLQAATYISYGNLNNHIGVPLSLARLPTGCQYAVFELAMNHPGEIALLAQQVKPDVAVITNVGPVHLAAFRCIEEIADAKAEIFRGMTTQGIAVLNRDDASFTRLSAHAQDVGITRILSFGIAAPADTHLHSSTLDADGTDVVAQIKRTLLRYRITIPGHHWVTNSLAILLTVSAVGADIRSAAQAMTNLSPLHGRGKRYVLTLAQGNQALLIDESYNASPMSVKAALDVMSRLTPGPQGRRIIVLGDMLELGNQTLTFHQELAPLILEAGIDRVFCCGRMMQEMYQTLPTTLQAAATLDSTTLAPLVYDDVKPGDVILVKGSRHSRIDTVIDTLLERQNLKKTEIAP